MTDISLSYRAFGSAPGMEVEGSHHVDGGAYLRIGAGNAHLTPEEARQLRNELNGILGETSAGLVVGARVVILAGDPGGSSADDGKAGRINSTDPGDTRYPYLVDLDDGKAVWCHAVRLVETEEAKADPSTGEGDGASAAVNAAFLLRRHAAVTAKGLLSGRVEPGSYGASPDAIMRLAGWLLGEN
ncbi:hypothetical protein [Kitasatospora sp. NPDC101183]|uniref:hypothetical protein n=1 Tax=Kitasatospora sp. NPDC101183 TaxID=3364100 RepID=UPI0037F90B8B